MEEERKGVFDKYLKKIRILMYRVMPKKTDIGGKECLRNLANQVCGPVWHSAFS